MMGVVAYVSAAILALTAKWRPSAWAAAVLLLAPLDFLRIHGISITNVVLVGLIIRILVQAASGYIVPRSRLFFRTLILFTVALFASWFAKNGMDSLRVLVALGGILAGTCALVASVRDSMDYVRLRTAFLWMGAIAAVSAVGEVVIFAVFAISLKQTDAGVGIGGIPLTLQASGLADGNAHLALFIVPSLVLAWMTRSVSTDSVERRRLACYVVLLSAATVATLSRAAILTLALFGVYRAVKAMYRLRGGLITGVVLLLSLAITLPSAARFLVNLSPESVYARLGIIIGAAQLAAERPVFGSGLGTRVRASAGFGSSVKNSVEGYDIVDLAGYEQERETHNTFLQIIVDMGAAGLIAYIAILVGVWRDARGVEFAYPAMVAVAFTNLFAAFNSLFYTKPIWFVAGLCAASVVALRGDRRASKLAINNEP